MFLCEPIPITESMFTSSLVENDYAAWDVATAYVLGDRVIYAHKIYEALTSTTGDQPDTSLAEWVYVDTTNKFRAFDFRSISQATAADGITYNITPSAAFTDVFFFGLSANTVTVTVTDPTDGVIFSETKNGISEDEINDFYDWCFLPIVEETEMSFIGIGATPTASISVTIENTGSTAKVAEIVVGYAEQIGITGFGTQIETISFSRRERDTFGNITIIPRVSLQQVTFAGHVNSIQARYIQKRLNGIIDSPAIFYAGPNLEKYGTTIFGILSEFSLPIVSNTKTPLSLEVTEIG